MRKNLSLGTNQYLTAVVDHPLLSVLDLELDFVLLLKASVAPTHFELRAEQCPAHQSIVEVEGEMDLQHLCSLIAQRK